MPRRHSVVAELSISHLDVTQKKKPRYNPHPIDVQVFATSLRRDFSTASCFEILTDFFLFSDEYKFIHLFAEN
jgi:hypothetical protein